MAVKVNRGGRYELFRNGGQKREPNKDTAGQKQTDSTKRWGTKREFIGSGSTEYTFYSESRGTLTIRADSYEEALRLARARGYSRKQYRRKK